MYTSKLNQVQEERNRSNETERKGTMKKNPVSQRVHSKKISVTK